MPLIRVTALDLALADVRSGTRIDICHTQEPIDYAEATVTYSCGNKTGIVVGAQEDNAPDGRKVVVPSITSGDPGDVTADGLVAFWALTNGADTLYAAGVLTVSQTVINGNTFILDAIDIAIRAAITS